MKKNENEEFLKKFCSECEKHDCVIRIACKESKRPLNKYNL